MRIMVIKGPTDINDWFGDHGLGIVRLDFIVRSGQTIPQLCKSRGIYVELKWRGHRKIKLIRYDCFTPHVFK